MATTLQLNFMTGEEKKVMLTVDEPNPSLTEAEVRAAMQTIIDAQAFEIEGSTLHTIVSAKIVERSVTDIVVG